MSKMFNEKEKQYAIKMQEQAEKIRILEEQVKALQSNQANRGNGAAISLQPVATGVVQNVQSLNKDQQQNSKYSTYNTHKQPTNTDLDNKENAHYSTSTLITTPMQPSKN